LAPNRRGGLDRRIQNAASLTRICNFVALYMKDYLSGLDLSIYHALNNFCGWSPVLDRLAVHGASVGGALFMGIVGAFWFSPSKEAADRRQTIIIILLAVALSLILNRALSTVVPFRYRPMYSVGANGPSFEWHADQENWSSFPSDNATYLFAIAAGFWLLSRPAGLLFGIFATCAVTSRVFWEYIFQATFWSAPSLA
jgi:undecaprenyl-diphosphatase